MPWPVGSPHCSTDSDSEVVSRWHVVSLKNPWLARLAKLLTVHGDLPLSSIRPISPWFVSMLALTCAGSVGTLPVRGGLTSLLALSGVAAYWQSSPRPAGAANAGSLPGPVGAGLDVVGVSVEAVFSLSLSPLVRTTAATTAATTMIAPTADPTIMRMRRLRSLAARRSSCRSSLRFAVARRCSLVGTAGVLLV